MLKDVILGCAEEVKGLCDDASQEVGLAVDNDGRPKEISPVVVVVARTKARLWEKMDLEEDDSRDDAVLEESERRRAVDFPSETIVHGTASEELWPQRSSWLMHEAEVMMVPMMG